MKGALGAVAGALCAAVIACGGARAKSPATAPVGAQAPEARSARAEIEELDRAIAEELARAHVAAPAVAPCSGPACAQAMAAPFAAPRRDDPTCKPAASEKCTDACNLAGSICDNQRRICELAQELAGDDWAAQKCESARASCKAAHDSCCSCVI